MAYLCKTTCQATNEIQGQVNLGRMFRDTLNLGALDSRFSSHTTRRQGSSSRCLRDPVAHLPSRVANSMPRVHCVGKCGQAHFFELHWHTFEKLGRARDYHVAQGSHSNPALDDLAQQAMAF